MQNPFSESSGRAIPRVRGSDRRTRDRTGDDDDDGGTGGGPQAVSALHVSTVSGECPAARVCRGLGMVDDVWLNNCGYTESLIHIPFIILRISPWFPEQTAQKSNRQIPRGGRLISIAGPAWLHVSWHVTSGDCFGACRLFLCYNARVCRLSLPLSGGLADVFVLDQVRVLSPARVYGPPIAERLRNVLPALRPVFTQLHQPPPSCSRQCHNSSLYTLGACY
jgi:hypothetical protein